MATSGFRQVIITEKSKLSYTNNYLVIRQLRETKRIYLDEIEFIIIENPACSITAFLQAELAKRNIKLLYCDSHHNPVAELVPLYGSYDCSQKLVQQIAWKKTTKAQVWQRIIELKLKHQAGVLAYYGFEEQSNQLYEESLNVKPADKTNREGMAARIYFNTLFGLEFNREKGISVDIVNSCLNYGYTILTSLFSRYIVAAGYLTRLGIFHRGTENQFNLSCDLMEPMRPIVDAYVLEHDPVVLGASEKHGLAKLIFTEVVIDGAKQTLDNAVPIYLRSVFETLESADTSLILDYEL